MVDPPAVFDAGADEEPALEGAGVELTGFDDSAAEEAGAVVAGAELAGADEAGAEDAGAELLSTEEEDSSSAFIMALGEPVAAAATTGLEELPITEEEELPVLSPEGRTDEETDDDASVEEATEVELAEMMVEVAAAADEAES